MLGVVDELEVLFPSLKAYGNGIGDEYFTALARRTVSVKEFADFTVAQMRALESEQVVFKDPGPCTIVRCPKCDRPATYWPQSSPHIDCSHCGKFDPPMPYGPRFC